MNFLKLEKITLEEGDYGHPFACRVYFTNGTIWTCEFKHLHKIMKLLGRSEEKKYKFDESGIEEGGWKEFQSGKFLLGRNLFFLSWIYPIYKKYLDYFGFNPSKKHLQHEDVILAKEIIKKNETETI